MSDTGSIKNVQESPTSDTASLSGDVEDSLEGFQKPSEAIKLRISEKQHENPLTVLQNPLEMFHDVLVIMWNLLKVFQNYVDVINKLCGVFQCVPELGPGAPAFCFYSK